MTSCVRFRWLASLALLCSTELHAAAPFSFDAAPGRLPKNVLPLQYTVSITPDLDTLAIEGRESVTLQVRTAADVIQFNSLSQTLSDVRFDGHPVREVVSDDTLQLTTVRLPRAAPAGRHVLSFAYRGRIETQPRGLFRQNYRRLDGSEATLLSTKMESTDARRMFPCWDEPAFRARFALSVTVPKAWAVIGNMPVKRRVIHGALATSSFASTPGMPSYLIEFTAGDLAQISATVAGTRLAIWADRGRAQDGREALANARQILADYNDYFGVRFPLPKLDSIAIPGGFGGAMENWGAITYNDQLLLITPRSTFEDRQGVYDVQAHEMAHQWNGDLVTMAWWDELWLNESFASWRASKQTDLRHPDWKWREADDARKESAMRADAFAVSHAIEQHVSDELQAANIFDPEITYDKGQAVLRMFEAYLGADTFRDGVRRYMKARAYSNSTSGDLWQALGAASHRDFAAVAAPWIEQPGFPVVDVASVCDGAGQRTVILSQHRFLLDGTDDRTLRWAIPVRLRIGVDGQPKSLLLDHDDLSAAAGRCDEALSLNPDAIAYYRVHFDAATLAANTLQFSQLPTGDRIALLDDQWALVESGQGDLGSYLALAGAMGAELDTRLWRQICTALETLEYDERGGAGHAAFTARARAILRPPADVLGWDARPGETPDVRSLRRTLIAVLGKLDDAATVSEARRRFAAFVLDPAAIAPDDQPVWLSIAARVADAAGFEQLHALAVHARDETEQRRYFGALMAVGDPMLARQAAAIALGDEIPPQGARWRFQLVAELAGRHPQLAWDTFSANAAMLLAPNPKYAPLITAQYVPAIFWDALPPEKLESWVRAHVPTEMAANVDRGMIRARFNLKEKAALVPATDTLLGMR